MLIYISYELFINTIDNRQSTIDNRQSTIDNRQYFKLFPKYNVIFLLFIIYLYASCYIFFVKI